MDDILKSAIKHKTSRRSFIGWSAAAVAGAAVMGPRLFKAGSLSAGAATEETEGRWISAHCKYGCGGPCLNKVFVKDGVVLKHMTDDTNPDNLNYIQHRACIKGRSLRYRYLGADRLKYPMKRKNWEPGGGKKELRGKDEWVRISWDEALDLVAGELKRIKEQYGNKAIMSARVNTQLLCAFGGHTQVWGIASQGARPIVHEKMAGCEEPILSDRMDQRKTKLLVLWGMNNAWSGNGFINNNLLEMKKAGAKVICVDPWYNATTQALADQWIPVRPSTDSALLLGMAYYIITNNLQDQAFLDKYTIGFDSEHMPEGIDTKENFKDYVLGKLDGIPKTPKWASEICGTEESVIKQFAHEVATTRPMIWNASCAPCRTHLGEQFVQAYLTVGWMTGNVGIPGAGIFMSYGRQATLCTDFIIKAGGAGYKTLKNPLHPYNAGIGTFKNPEKDDWFGVNYEEMYDAILKGEYTVGWRGKTKADIRMIYLIAEGARGDFLNQFTDISKGIEAVRKVEFFVTSDDCLSPVSQYADIVLPECSMWEKPGFFQTSNPETIFYQEQAMPPIFECKEGTWMEQELAKRLGIDPKVIRPISTKQMFFNQIIGATVKTADGKGREPLVTITEKDITEWGVTGKPQQGRVTISQLKEEGKYSILRTPDDNLGYTAYKDFRDNPEEKPLLTASGKLEIYCKALSDIIAAYGYDTLPPIAKYNPSPRGYESTFSDFKNKVKGDYPLQMFNTHRIFSSHSSFDNVPELREAWKHELYMNTEDAKARGIKNGDTVKIFSPTGTVIRPVYISERIIPGAVCLGEGAWFDIDKDSGIDTAGSVNMLVGNLPTGQGHVAYNTQIVQVEKYTGPLVPDGNWKQRIPL